MRITKIVLTGGPCAGKTTAMETIKKTFTGLGYKVIIVPESATLCLEAGLNPVVMTNYDFEKCIMDMQINSEDMYDRAAKSIYNSGDENILIVCDRGLLDIKIYTEESDFKKLLEVKNLCEVGIMGRYDAVFHLVTAAKGAEKYYTLENNKVRIETVEQAAEKDDELISAWTGHPHFRVIENTGNFETKMKSLINEISNFLGIPEPYEIERKYLIKYPNLELLECNTNCERVEIIQTYLKCTGGNDSELRVRQRGKNGSYTFFKTMKHTINGYKRIEIEERVSKDEYLRLLMESDTSKHQVRKTRYCLTYKGKYFEIDVYPFWSDKAIMEVELNNVDEKIDVPPFIEIIREVTNETQFKNSNIAKGLE